MAVLKINVKKKVFDPISIYYYDVTSIVNQTNGDDTTGVAYESFSESQHPTSLLINSRRDIIVSFGKTDAQKKAIIDSNGGEINKKVFLFIPNTVSLSDLNFKVITSYNKSISDGVEMGAGGLSSSLLTADYDSPNENFINYDISNGLDNSKGFSVLPFGVTYNAGSLCFGVTEVRHTFEVSNSEKDLPIHKFIYSSSSIEPEPISTMGYIRTKLETTLIC
ncbi:hypothetical protein ACMGDK_11380 [Chryseobacterium sp. DT-3]|uniref:hypothetical protein n=1 Tax=Chryseobacterium sp. DT-3 TaxID=3396164 RepID=UPI003F19CDB2